MERQQLELVVEVVELGLVNLQVLEDLAVAVLAVELVQ